jgi:hypothetical protein
MDEDMQVEPIPDARAWIVATVWAEAHRDQVSGADDVGAVLRGAISQQIEAVSALSTVDLDRLNAAVQALRGIDIDKYLRNETMGGVRFDAIDRCAPGAVRSEAMEHLARLLEDRTCQTTVMNAASAHPIEQLMALWRVWTLPRLDPALFGLVALTRGVVLGLLPPGEQFFVAMRIGGLA